MMLEEERRIAVPTSGVEISYAVRCPFCQAFVRKKHHLEHDHPQPYVFAGVECSSVDCDKTFTVKITSRFP